MSHHSLFKRTKSPIQQQIDAYQQRTQNNTSKYLRVPYFSESELISDATLKVIYERCSLSSSFTAAIEDLVNTSFSQGANVIEKPVEGLTSYDRAELNIETQKNFFRKLKDYGFNPNYIFQMLKEVQEDFEKTGNGYIQIKYVKVGDRAKFFFERINPRHINIRAPKVEGDKIEALKYPTFYISPSWTDDYLKKFNPQEVIATDMHGTIRFATYGGVESTVLHIKNCKGSFYGAQPKILAILEWLLVDFNLGDTTAKISQTETIAKNVFVFQKPSIDELEGDTDEDKAKNAREQGAKRAQSFRNITTSDGEEPSTIALIEAVDPNAVQHFSLDISRDSAYSQWVTDTAQNKIYGALGTSPRLNGTSQGASNLGGNANANENEILSKRVAGIQSQATNIIDRLFECMYELVGDEDLINYSLKFPNPLEVLDVMKNDSQNNDNNSNNDSNNTNTAGSN